MLIKRPADIAIRNHPAALFDTRRDSFAQPDVGVGAALLGSALSQEAHAQAQAVTRPASRAVVEERAVDRRKAQ
jgi:hypothetical protein